MPPNSCNQDQNCPWTEEQLEKFADLVADKALERIQEQTYQSIGKAFLSRIYYILGLVLIGAFFYLQSKGFIK